MDCYVDSHNPVYFRLWSGPEMLLERVKGLAGSWEELCTISLHAVQMWWKQFHISVTINVSQQDCVCCIEFG
eukprot:9206670-Ditylum_brightwellii.AAC.1